jgi:cytochrome d ubiquinol oxidase subunit II
MVLGALWLAMKTEDPPQERAVYTATGLWPVLLVVAVSFLIASAFSTWLYDNYIRNPKWLVVLLITVLALLGDSSLFIEKGLFKRLNRLGPNH